ncbi:hypothetical protein D3C86_2217520 [compost metagenome]
MNARPRISIAPATSPTSARSSITARTLSSLRCSSRSTLTFGYAARNRLSAAGRLAMVLLFA